MKQPGGAWLGQPRDLDSRARPWITIAAVARQSDPDDVGGAGLEALRNKASPRERCPRGRGASVPHRTVQARVDSEDKTARDGTPEPKNEKSGPTAGRKEHGQLQADRGQSAFSQRDREQPSDRDPPHTVHSTRSWRRQVRRNARTGPDSPDSA